MFYIKQKHFHSLVILQAATETNSHQSTIMLLHPMTQEHVKMIASFCIIMLHICRCILWRKNQTGSMAMCSIRQNSFKEEIKSPTNPRCGCHPRIHQNMTQNHFKFQNWFTNPNQSKPIHSSPNQPKPIQTNPLQSTTKRIHQIPPESTIIRLNHMAQEPT